MPAPSGRRYGAATTTGRREGGAASALLGILAVAVIAGIMVTVGVAPAIALTGVGTKNAIGLFENLPSELDIKPLQQKTEIYAKKGKKNVLIASFYNQNREVLEWDQVPESVKEATLAAEDNSYYDHGGIDPMGILRALTFTLLRKPGAGGASTITQQYVKNVCVQKAELLPTQDAVEAEYYKCTQPNVGRKISEARLAIGIEKKYSKDAILLGYLNIAGFGGRVYGIETAANYYFGKSAKKLSNAEAASLMAIVNQPDTLRLDVEENLAANKVRRDYILRSMLKYDFIEQKEFDEAIATKVEPEITPVRAGCAGARYNAGFFCNFVVSTIRNDESGAFGEDAGKRYNNLQSAGWKIYTTLDLDLQKKAQKTMNTYVPKKSPTGDLGAAATSVEVGTGRVLTMVQSKTYDDTGSKDTEGDDYTATSVNWNTDEKHGGSTGFQPGSTYKTFTLIDWLQNGRGLNEAVSGDERVMAPSEFTYCGDTYSGDSWDVNNDVGGEEGPRSVLWSTAKSVNGSYASMAAKLDLCTIRDTAKKLGVQRADGAPLLDSPATIIGTNEVAPLAMANAYAGIASQGEYCKPVVIDKVKTAEGEELEVPGADCKRVLDKQVAIATGYALNGVIRGGTAAGNQTSDGKWLFGKTGTSDSAKATWMVGGSTKVTTAVFVGNITGNLNIRNVKSFPQCRWSTAASNTRHCLWTEMMAANNAKYGGDTSWPQPESQFMYGKEIEVPDVTGKSVDEAEELLGDAGFMVEVGDAKPSDVEKDRIAEQNPGGGSKAPAGTKITIHPSTGEPAQQQPTVPDVTGQPVAQAAQTLNAAGYANLVPEWVPYQNAPCTVVGLNPAAGSAVPTDTQIKVTVQMNQDPAQPCA